MKSIYLIFFFISFSAQALTSPFVSTVDGLNIPNAHIIHNEKGVIIRSMAPKSDMDYEQIKKLGFTDILIFKKQTRKEVDKEMAKLLAMGFPKERIYHVPFKWSNFESFEVPCKQSLEALKIMKEVAQTKGRKLLVHCTVGEDRTGYIAGLFKIMMGTTKHQDVFRSEMCTNGYGAGNPNKPFSRVVLPIRQTLTPLFLKMAYKFELNYLSLEKLTESQCKIDPSFFESFQQNQSYQVKDFQCENSKRERIVRN